MPRSLGWSLAAAAIVFAFVAWIARDPVGAGGIDVRDASSSGSSERTALELAEVDVAGDERSASASAIVARTADGDRRVDGTSATSLILRGRVAGGTDGATPLRDAIVVAWRERTPGPVSRRETRTDPLGGYVLEIGAGTWFVQATADDHAPVARGWLAHVEGADDVVDFVLPARRRLDVQLADANGPIASYESIGASAEDWTVALWTFPGDDAVLGPPSRSADVEVGAFDFGHVAPGRYVLGVPHHETTKLRGDEVARSPAVVVVEVGGHDELDVVVPWVEPPPRPDSARRTRRPGR